MMTRLLFLFKCSFNKSNKGRSLIKFSGLPLFYFGLLLLYLVAYIFNLIYILFMFSLFYEIIFSIFVLFLDLLPSIIKACIIYLVFYFLFCLFNVNYYGYKQFT